MPYFLKRAHSPMYTLTEITLFSRELQLASRKGVTWSWLALEAVCIQCKTHTVPTFVPRVKTPLSHPDDPSMPLFQPQDPTVPIPLLQVAIPRVSDQQLKHLPMSQPGLRWGIMKHHRPTEVVTVWAKRAWTSASGLASTNRP